MPEHCYMVAFLLFRNYRALTWRRRHSNILHQQHQLADQFFFKFNITTNVLVISFRFIWILMLWVYGHYNNLIFFSAGIWRILTYKDGAHASWLTGWAQLSFLIRFMSRSNHTRLNQAPHIAWSPAAVTAIAGYVKQTLTPRRSSR